MNYVATLPGPHGMTIAFIAELIIAFILMTVVLNVSNTPHLARFTGIFAGALVATYITLEAPFSGMSMNPARTFSSAFVGHLWTGLWIYFIAPVLAMQFAATLYLRGKARQFIARNIITTTITAAFSIAALLNCSSASKRRSKRTNPRRSE